MRSPDTCRCGDVPAGSARDRAAGGSRLFFVFLDLFCRQSGGRVVDWHVSKGVCFSPSESTPCAVTEGTVCIGPDGSKEKNKWQRVQ